MTYQPLPVSAVNPDIVERHVSTFERVASEALANTLSGVGLGLLAGVGMWMLGAAWPTVATWATASAIAWTGAINWLRFSQDELQNRITFWQMSREIAEQDIAIDALQSENARLIDEIQWLKLRTKQPLRVNGRALEPETDPAHKDAIKLIEKRYGQGTQVTARMMMSIGWSDDRYKAAFALLKDAGIVEVRGTQTRWNAYHSPDEACSVLSLSSPVVLSDETSETSGGAA